MSSIKVLIYKLNKVVERGSPWRTPHGTLNQSVSTYGPNFTFEIVPV